MAPKQRSYDRCFNPLKLEKHPRKPGKSLRRVLPTMLRKLNIKNVEISADMKICDYCRLKLAKMPEIGEINDSSSLTSEDPEAMSTSEVIESSNVREDSLPSNESVDILKSNESSIGLRTSPIGEKKLPETKDPREKLEESRDALASKVFQGIEGESATESEENAAKCEIIEKLKEAFHHTNDRNKKIQILTIFRNWSSLKIHENFDVSDQMIAVANKTAEEHGILSTPDANTGKKLNQDTVNCVFDFYTCDRISRVMTVERNCIPVGENVPEIDKQKRLILTNLKETYRDFKANYPDLKIGFSKFCELRPKHCVLHGASGTHTVSVCAIHENMKLLLDGGGIAQLTSKTTQPLNNYKDCLKRIMCNPPLTECHLKQCTSCPGTENIVKQLEELFDEEMIDSVTYRQWVSADRTNLETMQTPVEDFLEKLQAQLESLVTHAFIAQQQSAYFAEKKGQLEPGVCLVVCNFVENYAFGIQDAIRGVEGNNDQATIHPFVAYYIEDGTIKQKNYIAISECLKHDAVAVHLFQRKFVDFLKREIREVNKIIYFSDGASAQYKNKRNFLNVCLHKEDYGVSAEWKFFATSHGKGPCDGIGGTLKRSATKSSLESPQEPINTPQTFFTWVKNNENIQNIYADFFTNEEYKEEAVALKARFEKATLVGGALRFHCIKPVTKKKIVAKRYSNAQKSVRKLVSK